jgi:subtilisin family serine protease
MVEPDWTQIPKQKIRDQAEYIWNQFHEDTGGNGGKDGHKEPSEGGIDVGVQPSADGVGFMYAEGQILIRENSLERVLEILGQPQRDVAEILRQPTGEAPIEPLIDGVVVHRLPRELPVLEALDRVDRVLGAGHATPDHVLTVAGDAGPCPATEPEVVYDGIEPYPSVAPGNDGAGISIYVADTGLLWYPDDKLDETIFGGRVRAEVTNRGSVHSWLTGVRGTLDRQEDLSGAQRVKPYEGHGTFVAGVVRCMAPGADIYVANAFRRGGSTLESHLVRHLDVALTQGYDLFHLSIAAPSRKDLPLMAFEHWLRRLHQYKGVACVVAAGNSGTSLPSWPAAFPEVVSVGALAADWRSRATFSNYGPWVDVYAPGRDLVNAFATGKYTCYTAPYTGDTRKFYGMAKWSGTSFSTPIVTGLIAARMSRTGENAQEAAAAILATARSQAIPGVGPVLRPY